jgi:Major Facilitator Superfamily
VFYVNLPLGALTLLVVLLVLKLDNEKQSNIHQRFLEIDWMGTFALIISVSSFLVILQEGGSNLNWGEPMIVALCIIGLISLTFFIYVEGWISINPIIPPCVIKKIHVIAVFSTAFFIGSNFFILIFYTPIWFQSVLGHSATNSGILTLPLVLSLNMFSILAGFFTSYTGIYYELLPIGSFFLAVSYGLLSTLNETSHMPLVILYLLLAGIGIGITIQTVFLASQVSVPKELLSQVTAM